MYSIKAYIKAYNLLVTTKENFAAMLITAMQVEIVVIP